MKHIFRFKQFEIDQTGCAMRINTDGVLLGTMAKHPDPQRILDIGTGTGVIALMLAQRFPKAQVHAVEIDEQASITAGRNFENSVFNRQLSVHHMPIEQYNNSDQFDLIVSNPPFFVNDLKNAEKKKEMARHASDTFFNDLIEKVAALLSPEGCFWVVLPVKQAQDLVEKAKMKGLFLTHLVKLHSDITKPEFRRIVCLEREKSSLAEKDFMIYESEKKYTKAYELLLKDFFLAY
ncbi:tRNA1(Val) (adenine(37)-N6)-methyltransferase [Pedobacter chitinilyticus]|uniref:tRNA1(Val) (adenine(37)-N6)-methyltransferase n=1 Tax=Pedobacter chitinilyticus TaxID=2233776 RepID=A0A443YJF1_9SPHI|nr:methyltransferase [Pedobacter chitinilyticus]RWU03884.1 methyltransferase domain-containing protein [Pedobacter chitinilyticus]